MMQPVMIFLLLPVLAAPVVIRAPHSTLSVVLSMFPTATPFLMLVRLAMTPPPPMWQVALSLVLTAWRPPRPRLGRRPHLPRRAC